MAADSARQVGRKIATARRLAHMTQQNLAAAADVSYSMVRAVERGARYPGDEVLEALAAALAVDPARLLGERDTSGSRIHAALPALSAAIAAYDVPDDGPVRPVTELRGAVDETVSWRLGAQYLRIAQALPPLVCELARALNTARDVREQQAVAGLLTTAFRSADAVSYKSGARDLSARLVELMRWSAAQAGDAHLEASAEYVRGETFFAAQAHAAGLRSLEAAIDRCPAPAARESFASRGALHMRAAVLAGRAANAEAAYGHLDEARRLADAVPEGVYAGTAFGLASVRVHEVSVSVGLGDGHLQRAVNLGRVWKPLPGDVPTERLSSFYIELGRAQLWSGLRNDAYESLKIARRIAPQQTRDHRWVREDIATLRRLKRSGREDLSNFADWCGAV